MNKNLQIGLVAFGTDGDIQPLIELALGLHRRGHQIDMVIVCLRNRDYSHLQQDNFNVQVVPFPEKAMAEEFVSAEFWHFSEQEFERYFEAQFDLVKNSIRRWSNLLAKKVDILISLRMMYPVSFAATQHKKPYICLHFAHSFIKSCHYPPFGVEDLGPEKNVESWRATYDYCDARFLHKYARFRQLYQLEPCTSFYGDIHHSKDLNLVAFSPALLPDNLDWDPTFYLCGYFKPESKMPRNQTDNDIQVFLENNDQVVAVTFGSLIEYESDTADFLQKISNSLRAAGVPAIIQTNKDYGLVSDEKILYATGYINHRAMFSKARLAIHHGGAGTSHVVTASGASSLLMPYGFDQFSIGNLLIKRGICHGILSRKEFDAEKFTRMICLALDNEHIYRRAKEIGQRMTQENGVEYAVRIIEEKYAQ